MRRSEDVLRTLVNENAKKKKHRLADTLKDDQGRGHRLVLRFVYSGARAWFRLTGSLEHEQLIKFPSS